MTDQDTNPPLTDRPLKERVDAARERLSERAANAHPVETVKGLIVEHPVASLAAGILLGALISKAIPASRKSATSARLGKSAASLAAVTGQFIADYAARAAEAGRDGLHKVEETGEAMSEKIVEGSAEARRKAVDFAELARSAAIEASDIAVRKIADIAARMKQ